VNQLFIHRRYQLFWPINSTAAVPAAPASAAAPAAAGADAGAAARLKRR